MASNLEFISNFSTSGGVENFDFQPFSAKYDVYKIFYTFTANTSTGYIGTRLLDSSGNVIAVSGEYNKAALAMRSYDTFFQNKSETGTSGVELGYNQGFGGGGELTIFNPFDSSKFTSYMLNTAGGTSSQLFGYKGMTVHKVAEQISGMRFYAGGGGSYGFEEITARVYGVK